MAKKNIGENEEDYEKNEREEELRKETEIIKRQLQHGNGYSMKQDPKSTLRGRIEKLFSIDTEKDPED